MSDETLNVNSGTVAGAITAGRSPSVLPDVSGEDWTGMSSSRTDARSVGHCGRYDTETAEPCLALQTGAGLHLRFSMPGFTERLGSVFVAVARMV
jgi:hypothetical protein